MYLQYIYGRHAEPYNEIANSITQYDKLPVDPLPQNAHISWRTISLPTVLAQDDCSPFVRRLLVI